jgi:deoxyribodipyrimidine photolyase-related protein
MSDYCAGCAYDVKTKTGEGACPFNLLYWDFVDRHSARFARNPRMAQIVRSWQNMDDGRKQTIRTEAAAFLARMDAGEAV